MYTVTIAGGTGRVQLCATSHLHNAMTAGGHWRVCLCIWRTSDVTVPEFKIRDRNFKQLLTCFLEAGGKFFKTYDFVHHDIIKMYEVAGLYGHQVSPVPTLLYNCTTYYTLWWLIWTPSTHFFVGPASFPQGTPQKIFEFFPTVYVNWVAIYVIN